MSLENSRKILKIFGILNIIAGVAAIVFGILALVGGSMAGSAATTDTDNAVVVAALTGAIVSLVEGIISLISGTCSVRAANDSSKIMPAWIFAILGLISGAVGVINNLVAGGGISGILGSVIAMIISALIFIAANTIKQSK